MVAVLPSIPTKLSGPIQVSKPTWPNSSRTRLETLCHRASMRLPPEKGIRRRRRRIGDELLTVLSTVVNNPDFARCCKGLRYAKSTSSIEFLLFPQPGPEL